MAIITSIVKFPLMYWIAVKTKVAINIDKVPQSPKIPAKILTSIHKATNGDDVLPVVTTRVAIVADNKK